MKKYLSVFSLFIRSDFLKVILISITSLCVQLVMFLSKLDTTKQWDGTLLGIEPIIYESKAHIVFVAGLLLLSVVLSLFTRESSGKSGYTIRRLSISEKKFLLLHSTYCFLAITIYLIINLLGALCMFGFYTFSVSEATELTYPGFISNQTIFLAFIRNDYLHNLMPVYNTLRILRNLIFICGTGFCCAALPYFQRRKKIAYEALLFLAITGFGYIYSWNEAETDFFLIVCCIILLSILFIRLKGADECYES